MVETCAFFFAHSYTQCRPQLLSSRSEATPHENYVVVSQKSAHPLLSVPCIGVKVYLNECPPLLLVPCIGVKVYLNECPSPTFGPLYRGQNLFE